jgi:hypothetical protein
MDIDMLWAPAVLENGRITVSYAPAYRRRKPDTRLSKGSPDLEGLVDNPVRIINRGILFHYDVYDLPVRSVTLGGSVYAVPRQPVWVLPNGFVTINVSRMIQDFEEAIDGLVALLSLPADFQEGLAEGRYRIRK